MRRKTGIWSILLLVSVQVAFGLLSVHGCDGQSGVLKVEPNKGYQDQSLVYSYWVSVGLNRGFTDLSTGFSGNAAKAALADDTSAGKWDCHNRLNYKVTVGGRVVNVERVYAGTLLGQDGSCAADFAGKADVVLLLSENRLANLSGSVQVEFLGVPYNKGKLTLTGTSKSVIWAATILTLSAQQVPNENLNNKAVDKDGVYQFPISATYDFLPNRRGGWLVDSKDLFSTNERDTQSAFKGGLGYQVGLSSRWYLPLKFEQQVQGNQVVTNLSAVANAQLTTSLPFDVPLKWGGIDAPMPPALTFGFPYTHRINQVVAAGATPLPTNDFAMNPALALTGGRLAYFNCNPQAGAGKYPGVCLNWEADVGLWYLPLEKTARGSQKAEGYWDTSLLVPIADFVGIPFVALDSKTQVSQMQLRIKYEDAVSATNNYARTKKWAFGLELVHK